MDDEPTNRAVKLYREMCELLSDRERAATEEGTNLFAPSFVRVDRRRVITQPPADRDELITAIFEYETMTGVFPRMWLDEVVALRGDRLGVGRFMFEVGDVARNEMADVFVCDEAGERLELIVRFDPEDVDLALAELDRLHAELTHG